MILPPEVEHQIHEQREEIERLSGEVSDLKETTSDLQAMLVQLLDLLVDRPGRLKKNERWVFDVALDEDSIEGAIEQIKELQVDAGKLAEWTETLDGLGFEEPSQLEHYDADAHAFFETLHANLETRSDDEDTDTLTLFKAYLERSGVLPHATTYSPEQLADTFANILLV